MSVDYKKYPFSKRIRHHISPNLYIPIANLKFKPDSYPDVINEINWRNYFINGKRPDVIDIGCGKGAFLIDYALLNPNHNILGIEIRITIVEWVDSIIKGENIENCGIQWYNVANSLSFIADSSIEKIFFLFPDPWFKYKHNKRRAFNNSLLDEINRLLKPDGLLYIATDVPEIDVYHRDEIKANGKFNFKIIDSDEEWGLPQTNKEKFCRKNDIPFYRLICSKMLK
jgi:tRNA (guanine-N7-)-methyltransferase